MGSGARHALAEALLWASAALAGLGLLYFHDDLLAALRASPADPRATAHSDQDKPSGLAAIASGFDREARLTADARGHFVFEAAVNERPVTLMADTGATLVVLTFEDANRLGLHPKSLDFSGRVRTANGAARIAPVTIAKMRVADITLRDVPAAVAEPGALPVNLLGMSFLGRLKRFEVSGRELVLVQ